MNRGLNTLIGKKPRDTSGSNTLSDDPTYPPPGFAALMEQQGMTNWLKITGNAEYLSQYGATSIRQYADVRPTTRCGPHVAAGNTMLRLPQRVVFNITKNPQTPNANTKTYQHMLIVYCIILYTSLILFQIQESNNGAKHAIVQN